MFKKINNQNVTFDQIMLKNSPKNSYSGASDYFNKSNNLYRGTNFRGVSRNGRCNWQILTMIDSKKIYLGTVDDILKAAILYDLVSIQVKGLKAKTNFIFTKKELLAVLQLDSLMSIKSVKGSSSPGKINSQNNNKITILNKKP